MFTTLQVANRDILQLFIATTGKLQSATSLNLREPFPTTFQSSLIVSSEIAYSNVIPASFSGAGITLQGNEPPDNQNLDKTWSASVAAGSISGPYNVRKVSTDTTVGIRGITFTTEYYVGVPGNVATIQLTGMNFECDSTTLDAKMSMTSGYNYTYKYGSRESTEGGPWSNIDYHNYQLGVNITMYADLRFQVTGQGQNQLIQISPIASTNPLITGNIEPPAGACKSNDRDLQQSFLQNLNSGMKPKLETMLQKDFPAISVFALKNIIFPAKNFIDLKEAHLPGDLVIFGDFTTETT